MGDKFSVPFVTPTIGTVVFVSSAPESHFLSLEICRTFLWSQKLPGIGGPHQLSSPVIDAPPSPDRGGGAGAEHAAADERADGAVAAAQREGPALGAAGSVSRWEHAVGLARPQSSTFLFLPLKINSDRPKRVSSMAKKPKILYLGGFYL